MNNVLILGSGPSGLTAAIYAARAELKPLVFDGETPGGQLMWTSVVENFPGFPEGIQGSELMMRMRKQAERFGAQFKSAVVESVDFSGDPLKVTAAGEQYETKTVILALGASHRWLGVKGEEEFKNKGVSACATCDGALFRDKDLVVVGGGDSAMEEATFLTKFAKSVKILVREAEGELVASKAMVQRAANNEKIEFLWNTEVEEVFGDTIVQGVKIVSNKTGEKGELAVQGMFVAIGLEPKTGFLEGHIELEKGFIVVHNVTSTSVEGVFASGDVHDYRYRQAITAAGYGCMAALDVEKYLAGKE